ncbi:hypothetical protein M1N08_00960, partial [Dehalococcoidia bacterium]|nr:hypothetical protein [Dehalococcoidia bacterium]
MKALHPGAMSAEAVGIARKVALRSARRLVCHQLCCCRNAFQRKMTRSDHKLKEAAQLSGLVAIDPDV